MHVYCLKVPKVEEETLFGFHIKEALQKSLCCSSVFPFICLFLSTFFKMHCNNHNRFHSEAPNFIHIHTEVNEEDAHKTWSQRSRSLPMWQKVNSSWSSYTCNWKTVFLEIHHTLRNECLFFWVHGEGIEVRDKQIVWTAKQFLCDLLVPCSKFFPMNPEKRDNHSLYLQCFQQSPFLKFSEKSYRFKIPAVTGT